MHDHSAHRMGGSNAQRLDQVGDVGIVVLGLVGVGIYLKTQVLFDVADDVLAIGAGRAGVAHARRHQEVPVRLVVEHHVIGVEHVRELDESVAVLPEGRLVVDKVRVVGRLLVVHDDANQDRRGCGRG